jgi:modulator of FtsH protease
MGGMLGAGILVAFLSGLVAVFIPGLTGLSMAVSVMFVLLMSGLILYQTSEIIHGGETNYISATLTLFVTIYNIFTSLLQLFGIIEGED